MSEASGLEKPLNRTECWWCMDVIYTLHRRTAAQPHSYTLNRVITLLSILRASTREKEDGYHAGMSWERSRTQRHRLGSSKGC